jgi:hypothetical protein
MVLKKFFKKFTGIQHFIMALIKCFREVTEFVQAIELLMKFYFVKDFELD